MNSRIKVCIADDNVELANNLASYLSQNERIYVTKVCKDGEEAINTLTEENVDILITDIIMPKIDGIGVLEKIEECTKQGKIDENLGIIIVSAINHDNMKFDIFSKGVNYYMSKPIDLETIEQRIIGVYEGIHDIRSEIIDKELTNKLYELGIYPNILGYKYIKQCVDILIQRPCGQKDFRTNIYTVVAKRNNQSVYRVERAIINALNTSWSKNKKLTAKLLKNKLYEIKKPSTQILLTTIAEEIRNKAS